MTKGVTLHIKDHHTWNYRQMIHMTISQAIKFMLHLVAKAQENTTNLKSNTKKITTQQS
jgi:hypothetical protein